MKTYYYIIDEYGHKYPDDAMTMQSNIGDNFIASVIAEDYWDNHDGWEDSWPVTFDIYDDEHYLGKYEVEMESEPVFYDRLIPQ